MEINKEQGQRAVKIKDDIYSSGSVEVLVMRNGFQWTGFWADKELLKMLRDALDEYLVGV